MTSVADSDLLFSNPNETALALVGRAARLDEDSIFVLVPRNMDRNREETSQPTALQGFEDSFQILYPPAVFRSSLFISPGAES